MSTQQDISKAAIEPTTINDAQSTHSQTKGVMQPTSHKYGIFANAAAHDDPELAHAFGSYVPGTAAEKAIVRKIDFILLPCLWWMYILAYLDRGNIANANAAGLSEDLGMSDNQYSLFIATFFVGYFLFEVPSNLVMGKLRPSFYLPSIVTAWGAVVIGMSQAKGYEGFLIGRFFLGAIEAGLFPGAIFMISCYYKRDEVAKRICIFYTSGCVAPAIGGLFAGGIISGLDGAKGMPGWRWLLLVEGVLTVVCGIGFYFILPDYPHNCRYLTPEQRRIAHVRIMHDRDLNMTLDAGKLTSFQAVKAVVCDPKCWLFLFLYTLDCTCTTISYFIPTILKSLGYTSVTAQWMTVPIWTTGGVCMLVLSYTSDKTQDRRWHIVGLFTAPIIACLVSLFVSQGAAKYAMMCFLIAGIYTAVPLILNWASEVVSFPSQKRSVSIAFINSFGHLSLIYGSYLWPSANAPRHVLGFSAVAALCAAAALLAFVLPFILKVLPKTPATSAERAILAADEEERAAASAVHDIK